MSWTFITVTFIQDVYIFKKYSTQRQLLKTGRLLKTQEYMHCIGIAISFIFKLPTENEDIKSKSIFSRTFFSIF